jgi:hypothetical protein
MRWLAAGIAAAVCAAEASALVAGRARPPIVTRAPIEAPAYTEGPSGLEPGFLAHMTPDDVARGVWALADERGAVALTAEQRAALAPLIAEGAATRERLGLLRAERQAEESAWLVATAEAARLASTAEAAR